jgi:hypothetical protein
MKQAALFDGFAFDPFPFQHDEVAAPKVDVGGSEIADAFVVAAMVVVIDERRDIPLEITRQEVVFQQDAVLQRLVPASRIRLERRSTLPLPTCRRISRRRWRSLSRPVPSAASTALPQ